MIDPLDFEKTPLLTRLSRTRTAAAFVMWLETAAESLWRLASWCAVFAGLWMMQIPQVLGDAGPALACAAFTAGMVFLTVRDLPHLRLPHRHDIDRRLERDSNLPHRPLAALEDRLANPRLEQTRTIWRHNLETAFAAVPLLRLPRPRPLLARRDPRALRMLAALTLVAGLAIAGPQWNKRLAYGLFPFNLTGRTAHTSPITLWITPPDYTGLPRIVLEGSGKKDGEALKIPEGSTLKIRLSGGVFRPVLNMGDTETPLTLMGDRNWGLETQIRPGTKLTVKQALIPRATVPYSYIPDTPPVLTLEGGPETLEKGDLKFSLKAQDDYGVADLAMTMDLDPMIEDRPLGSPYEETRAVMTPPAAETPLSPVYGLSWHPWAGMPVVIGLEAVDRKGQKSALPPVFTTLPERAFSHPVAKKLAALRKSLIWTPAEAARDIPVDLETILQDPAAFGGDITVLLSLRSAATRLSLNTDAETIARVVELLWDTALRIEDGNLPHAARSLQEAQSRLEKLLQNPNATEEEIARAMHDLREAMAGYFQELARELQKRMAESGANNILPPEMFQNAVRPEELESFLDRLQSEALTGNRESAREMLSQLRKFTDRIDPSMSMSMPPQMQFMMDGISEMQELVQKQEELLDQTKKQADSLTAPPRTQRAYPQPVPFAPHTEDMMKEWNLGAMPPPPQETQPPPAQEKTPPPSSQTAQASKTEQEALRFILGRLMLESDEQLGEIPEPMQKAEQEMRGSAESLGAGDPAAAIPHQEAAIDYLQQSMQDMAQQMRQMMQAMAMFSLGGSSLDPLGRPMQEGNGPGFFPGSRVTIPDEAERKRVQEILKILRRRSGEVGRPDYELDYYRRLMKQF